MLFFSLLFISCDEPLNGDEKLQSQVFPSESSQVAEERDQISDDGPQAREDYDQDNCRCFMRLDEVDWVGTNELTVTFADVTYPNNFTFDFQIRKEGPMEPVTWEFPTAATGISTVFPSKFFELPNPSAGDPEHMFYLGNGLDDSNIGMAVTTTTRCYGDSTPDGRFIDPEVETPMREFSNTFRFLEEFFPGVSRHFASFTCFDEQAPQVPIPLGG